MMVTRTPDFNRCGVYFTLRARIENDSGSHGLSGQQ